MKNKIFFLSVLNICLVCIIGCDSNQSEKSIISLDYYDDILNDFSTQSYYLALDVKPLHDTSFIILIQNDDLWYALKDERGYSIDKYKTEIKNLLVTNGTLHLDSSLNKRIAKYRFDKGCGEILEQDTLSIKKNYFEKGRLKLKYESDNRLKRCIIYALYKKQILIRNNDESGLPIIR